MYNFLRSSADLFLQSINPQLQSLDISIFHLNLPYVLGIFNTRLL